MNTPSPGALDALYGEHVQSGARYSALARTFAAQFGGEPAAYFSAPGRTEILGNHTDHNGGRVLAASIDRDTIAAARPNATDTVRILSAGYGPLLTLDLGALERAPKAQGTFSLLAGLFTALRAAGYAVQGFDAALASNVISAAGVSSSASFEMLICAIVNAFFNRGEIDVLACAKAGQFAENAFWRKGSGLMDQIACAVGGCALIDFADPAQVRYTHLDFSFAAMGYDLTIVGTGAGHADLNDAYSAIPQEMRLVARALGVDVLGQSDLQTLLAHMPDVGSDRALLRALHFYTECQRVDDAAAAIARGDSRALLALVQASGDSSWKWLQNACAGPRDQKVARALALSALFLQRIGDGCCRLHGGGFAGVIMCVTPLRETAAYLRYMAPYVGEENLHPMRIRAQGAVQLA
nr:galactokinase family protein [Maliibacterium massiliense]